MLNTENIKTYIKESLRYTLFSEADQNNEYDIEVNSTGISFIPIYPITYVIDDKFYDKVFNILSLALTPQFTLIKPLTMQVITIEGNFNSQRGLFFPWYKGTPERLVGSIGEMIQNYHTTGQIPLMKKMSWNYAKYPGCIISGNSGSGKSYFLKTLYSICSVIGKTVIVDPKVSDLARMSRTRAATKSVIPELNNDTKGIGGRFVAKVDQTLQNLETEMYKRQEELFRKSKKVSTDYRELGYKPIFIFIDELAALMTGANKKVSQPLMDTLTRIAVLGRESGLYLILSLQSARAEFVPDIVRQQLSLKVLLGRINRQTAQFLFPELSSVPMIPLGGMGTGIATINGDPRFSGIEPIATPTITEDK